jgi:hypothetical protein
MNFNKHISLFLVFFLLVSNLGVGLNVHYCGGAIASVSPAYLETAPTWQNAEKDCCAVVIEKKDNCCKDKLILVQKKLENSVVKSFSLNLDRFFIIQDWSPAVFSKTSNFKNTLISSYQFDANGPPFFELYNQYIFYA